MQFPICIPHRRGPIRVLTLTPLSVFKPQTEGPKLLCGLCPSRTKCASSYSKPDLCYVLSPVFHMQLTNHFLYLKSPLRSLYILQVYNFCTIPVEMERQFDQKEENAFYKKTSYNSEVPICLF